MKCQTFGCSREPRAGYARCDDCTRRLLRGAFSASPEPERDTRPMWLRRGRLSKDFTGAVHAS